jgi:hypothetical protein
VEGLSFVVEEGLTEGTSSAGRLEAVLEVDATVREYIHESLRLGIVEP